MKYFVIVAVLVLALAAPAFAQFRIDLGVDVPMTVGTLSGSGVETYGEAGDFLRSHILPFPEASFDHVFVCFVLEHLSWDSIAAQVEKFYERVQSQYRSPAR